MTWADRKVDPDERFEQLAGEASGGHRVLVVAASQAAVALWSERRSMPEGVPKRCTNANHLHDFYLYGTVVVLKGWRSGYDNANAARRIERQLQVVAAGGAVLYDELPAGVDLPDPKLGGVFLSAAGTDRVQVSPLSDTRNPDRFTVRIVDRTVELRRVDLISLVDLCQAWLAGDSYVDPDTRRAEQIRRQIEETGNPWISQQETT